MQIEGHQAEKLKSTFLFDILLTSLYISQNPDCHFLSYVTLYLFFLSQQNQVPLLFIDLFFDHFLHAYYPECLRTNSTTSLTKLGQFPIHYPSPPIMPLMCSDAKGERHPVCECAFMGKREEEFTLIFSVVQQWS